MSEIEDLRRARIENGVLAIREGHGANCSSIGSVIDTIFASAVLGGTIFAAVVASLGREKVRVAGRPLLDRPPTDPSVHASPAASPPPPAPSPMKGEGEPR
jgi:hypothetical protein